MTERILAFRTQATDKRRRKSHKPAPAALSVAASVGVSDFIIQRELGRGSYATVFQARERHSQALVALKKVSKAHVVRYDKAHEVMREKEHLLALRPLATTNTAAGSDGQTAEKTRNDAADAATAATSATTSTSSVPTSSWSWVVPLFLTLQDRNDLYFVLQLCPNGDMQQLLWRYACLGPDTLQFYASEVVAAIAYMHERNIVHRDLKPDNLLLDHHMHIKVADLAASRQVPPDVRKPRANSFVGTPEYVAPEILEAKPATLATDWWGLGCLLVRMATGRVPFAGATQYLLFEAILQCKYKLPDKGMAEELGDLIRRLLVVDPSQRLGSKESGGAAAVQADPYFRDLTPADWSSLHLRPAPVVGPYVHLDSFHQRPALNGPDHASLSSVLQSDGSAAAEPLAPTLTADSHLTASAVSQLRTQQASCPWLALADKSAALILAVEAQLLFGMQPPRDVMLILDTSSRLHVRDRRSLDSLHVVYLTAQTGADAWAPDVLLVDTPRRVYYFLCSMDTVGDSRTQWERGGPAPAVRMADLILQLVALQPAVPRLEEGAAAGGEVDNED